MPDAVEEVRRSRSSKTASGWVAPATPPSRESSRVRERTDHHDFSDSASRSKAVDIEIIAELRKKGPGPGAGKEKVAGWRKSLLD